MSTFPNLKRGLAAGLTVCTLSAVMLIASCNRAPAPKTPPPKPMPGPVAIKEVTGKEGAGKQPVVAVQAPKAASGDWTMFGGDASRNMVNTVVKNLPVEWSTDEGDEKNITWVADLGSRSYGGPVVAGGHVYVGTNNKNPRDKKWIKNGEPIDLGVFMAFAEKDGKFLWQTAYPKLKAGRVVDWPEEGLCSTAAVEGDRLYYVSNRCEVVCSKTDGSIVWKLDMIEKLDVFPHNLAACSPLVVGNDLWIVTANGVDEGHINVPQPQAPSFLKLDKRDGKVLWKNNDPSAKLTESPTGGDQKAFIKQLVNRGELIQHGQWSNPAYAVVGGQAQVLFPGGDGWIYSFDPDGKLLWKFDCNPKDAIYELGSKGTRNDFVATPVIYDNKAYIGVGQDPEHLVAVGHLWCIDMTKRGDVSPELVTDNSVFPPKTKPNPNSAKVWHYGGFTTPEDRKKLSRNYYFGRTMSTCAVHDGLVYASDLNGWINCLDAATGNVYWTHDTGAELWCSPYWADGKIYMGNDNGTVLVFAHGKEKKVLAENFMPGPVRASPVAANGVLYVMTSNKLYAIANK
ncbi:MAG: PQQ-binding-like beta-propeller repeat protein [Gemmataceae bacterium]|nr:PQQ-binding-like beta-propeller repeat protein [Gemmataceae bacterium]